MHQRNAILASTALVAVTFVSTPSLMGQTETAPRIRHQRRDIQGWPVEVDTRLLDQQHKALGTRVLELLGAELLEIATTVPAPRVRQLRTIRIVVDLDHPLNVAQYHPNVQWLRTHGYDPALAKAVHIPNAKRFIKLIESNRQPWVAMHELAHAYHDQVLGFDYAPIRSAFLRVARGKQLESVLHIGGQKRKHYALTDHKEFFAEMTEAYLGTNDFYPFVRAELKVSDSDTFALLEEIWGEIP